jgi:hypothetical protein
MGYRENQFSEGVALGLLMAGFDALPQDKVGIELAFRSVWRSWPHARQFPFVGSRSRADELYQMTDAGRRHRTHYLYWEGNAVVHRIADPRRRPTADEIAESIGSGVPAEEWMSLMGATMRRYLG